MRNRGSQTNRAVLILENGDRFAGKAFGYIDGTRNTGEVVFANLPSGAQEYLTDPASAGQIVVMTYPAVGNYGFNLEDMEADFASIKGLIVREKCDNPNNWRCEMELDGFLKQNKVIGVEGIDTRALAKVIRDNGSMRGIIVLGDTDIKIDAEKAFVKTEANDSVRRVKHKISGSGGNLAVIDFGTAKSAINELQNRGLNISVYQQPATVNEILADNPGAVFLSNGAGNPLEMEAAVKTVKGLLGKAPVFGVGLGCCILTLALDGSAERLKYGHHGGGMTVRDVSSGLLYVTNQNHSYAPSNLKDGTEVSFVNVNDGSIEGIKNIRLNAHGIMFYPETLGFSRNTGFFLDMIKAVTEGGEYYATR